MHRIIKTLFWLCILKPFVLFYIGLNTRGRQNLPQKGPLIIIANHNSHLDTLVLFSLFPIAMLNKIRPVAAADYFLKNTFLKWFSLNIMGIIPMRRDKISLKENPFQTITDCLDKDDIIIFFPEGTRGQPEQMQSIKKGIGHLAKQRPEVPIVPIFLHGLGKSLPKGEGLIVPFFCDVFVGPAIKWSGNHDDFLLEVQKSFETLSKSVYFPTWE